MAYITNFEPFVPEEIDYTFLGEIENKIINKESLTSEEASFFLDHLGYLTRIKISPDLLYFRNKCDLSQAIQFYYLEDLGLEPIPSMTQNAITKNIIGHNFLTVKLSVENQERIYLLDATYIQFFYEDSCTYQSYYVSPLSPDTILLTPDPGYFVRNSQKPMAQFLLDHGYSLLTPEVARMYGDSFLNTKQGVSKSNLRYQSIPGEVYINSFTKTNCTLSKTKEELIDTEMRIAPVSEQVVLK